MDLQSASLVVVLVLSLVELLAYVSKGPSLFRPLWLRMPIGRRRAAYRRLQRLTPNVQLAHFSEVLGLTPIYKGRLDGLSEAIFRHVDFYVQVLSDTDDQVVFYSVTTRNTKFKPSLWPNKIHPEAHPRPPTGRLGEVSFEEISTGGTHVVGATLFIRGATAPTEYIEAYYYGYPGWYQHFVAGLNECGPIEVDPELMQRLLGPPVAQGILAEDPDYDREEMQAWLVSGPVRDFRKAVSPNVYGVASGRFTPGNGFRLGPNPTEMATI